MSRWKIATVVVPVIVCSLVAGILTHGFGFVAGKELWDQLTGRASADVMISELRNQGYLMFDTMQQELPGDYATLTQKLEAMLARRSTAAQAWDETLQLTAAIRRKHATWMRQAPDDSLHALIKAQLDLTELVARESPATCTRFAMTGSAALTKQDKQHLLAIDAIGTQLIRAIGAAQRNPQPAEAVTDGDRQAFDKALAAQGGTADDVRAITALDPKDENLCKAVIRLFRTALTLEGPAGRRLRAEIAYGLAAS